DARVLQRVVQAPKVAGVGQLVENDETIRRVRQRIAHEIGADESSATRDEERTQLHSSPFWILQCQPQLLGEGIDGRAASLPRAFGFETEIADPSPPWG